MGDEARLVPGPLRLGCAREDIVDLALDPELDVPDQDTGQRLKGSRQDRLEPLLDLQAVEDPVGEVGGQLVDDLRVADDRPGDRRDPGIAVQQGPMGPDRDGREDERQAGQDEEDPRQPTADARVRPRWRAGRWARWEEARRRSARPGRDLLGRTSSSSEGSGLTGHEWRFGWGSRGDRRADPPSTQACPARSRPSRASVGCCDRWPGHRAGHPRRASTRPGGG